MAHQLENLNIRAFRQLRDVEFQNLGRVNLLVGVNNSGKTSVLEAIAAHCQPLDPWKWLEVARQREGRAAAASDFESMHWLFPQRNQGIKQYGEAGGGRLCIEGSGVYPNRKTTADFVDLLGAPVEPDDEEVEPPRKEFDERLDDGAGSSLSAERGAAIVLRAHVPADQAWVCGADANGERSREFQLWETKRYVSTKAPANPFSPVALPVATISPFAHRVQPLQTRQLTELTLSKQKQRVVEAIQLIDPDIEDLVILSRTGIQSTLYVQNKQIGLTPLSALGDGVRRVVTIALHLIIAAKGVLLVDEIESAIHKDALTKVFQWLVVACEQFDVQLFATTHSLEAVDSLLEAQHAALDELVAFRLPSQHTNQVLIRYSGDALHGLRYEGGMEVR